MSELLPILRTSIQDFNQRLSQIASKNDIFTKGRIALHDVLCLGPFAQQLQQERDNKRKQRQLFNKLFPFIQQFFDNNHQLGSNEECNQLEAILVQVFGDSYDEESVYVQIGNLWSSGSEHLLSLLQGDNKIIFDTKVVQRYISFMNRLWDYLKHRQHSLGVIMSSSSGGVYTPKGHNNIDIKPIDHTTSYESDSQIPLANVEQFKQYLVRIEKELFASLE